MKERSFHQILVLLLLFICALANAEESNSIDIQTLSGDDLRVGGRIRRLCVVTGPSLNVYWRKPDGSRVDGRYLIMDNIESEDAGSYRCIAENIQGGITLSTSFELNPQSNSVVSVDIETLPGENLVVGGQIRRKCVVTDSSWNVYWIKPDGSRVEGTNMIVNNIRSRDAGRYTCHAEDRQSGSTLSSWFSVSISRSTWRQEDNFDSSAYNVDIQILSGESLVVGGQIRRQCVVNGNSWNVYWTKPDGSRVDSPYMIVNNLGSEDAGRYTCHAQNRENGATMSSWFSVSISRRYERQEDTSGSRSSSYSLDIEVLPDQKLAYGGVLSLRCRIDNPNWRVVYWALPDGSRRPYRDLRVTNIRAKDLGSYWCIAKENNSERELKAEYRLGG